MRTDIDPFDSDLEHADEISGTRVCVTFWCSWSLGRGGLVPPCQDLVLLKNCFMRVIVALWGPLQEMSSVVKSMLPKMHLTGGKK